MRRFYRLATWSQEHCVIPASRSESYAVIFPNGNIITITNEETFFMAVELKKRLEALEESQQGYKYHLRPSIYISKGCRKIKNRGISK